MQLLLLRRLSDGFVYWFCGIPIFIGTGFAVLLSCIIEYRRAHFVHKGGAVRYRLRNCKAGRLGREGENRVSCFCSIIIYSGKKRIKNQGIYFLQQDDEQN